MADGLAEGKIFAESKDGDESNGEGDGPGGSEKNDSKDDGDEHKGSEDAGTGHE